MADFFEASESGGGTLENACTCKQGVLCKYSVHVRKQHFSKHGARARQFSLLSDPFSSAWG
jgi:hypothetical protein